MPQVDGDGNERDGVRLPEMTVPLATYAGWNLCDPSIGAPDQRVAFEASYLPFPRTFAEREKASDPRKSQAVDDLVNRRWILPEDRVGLLGRCEREWAENTQ